MAYNALIVDDSASTRFIIAKALRLSGLQVAEMYEASDGREALDLLSTEWIDVVLADLNMPNMGGIELIERMRDLGITGRVPVVVVSTEARADVIESLLQSGAAAFLRKPFSPQQLDALVRAVLESAGSAPDDVLETAFNEAVEGFALMIGDSSAETAAPQDAFMASIQFVGPGIVGDLVVAASPETCQEIVRSATGDADGDGLDALAELANVTAGQLIRRLPGGPFALQPPQRRECLGTSAWGAVDACATSIAFDVERHGVMVGLDVRNRWQ